MLRRRPLAEVFRSVMGPDSDVSFSAYDGSRAGRADAPVGVDIRSPDAVGYLVTSPGQLGLARAYVSSALDVRGDLYTALATLRAAVGRMPVADRLRALRDIGPAPLLRRPPAPPPQETRRRRVADGLRHSKRRDSGAISHHYDVSNRFYELVLGPSMAYTCAVFPRRDATLEEAQAEKFDLVCRKLGLRPGMRLLDVGCGWGGMALHAAEHYGARVLAVTLSRQQADWGAKAAADAGLTGQVEIRHADYRDVTEDGFDAVSSIGLTEHIGAGQLSAYVRFLRSRLRPQGRLLNHCITRPSSDQPPAAGSFLSRYVFPDGELESAGTLMTAIQDGGFEVRHEENLREHYALTLAAWGRNLEAHWDEAVAEVGEGTARVWRLYMAGSRLGFDSRRVELHQILAVRADDGDAGMPLRPDWEARG